MTKRFDYDLFVIGGGSGGVRAARMAAERGARTAIAEESTFGGTCVNLGCIPKKFFVYACAFPEEFEDAVGYGWTVEDATFDWPTLIANKDKQIARLNGYYRRAVERAGGIIIEDRAVLKDRHTVHLVRSGRDVTAKTILIATGGYPSRMADFEGAEHCITSDEAFHLKTLPKSIAIVGGGYIALEFAHIFRGLGAEVTLIYRGSKVLRGFDEDLRDALQETMRQKGIRLILETAFTSCHCEGADDPRRHRLGRDLRGRADHARHRPPAEHPGPRPGERRREAHARAATSKSTAIPARRWTTSMRSAT